LKGLEIQLVGYAENTKRSKKSRALGMTKERVAVHRTVALSVIPSEAEGSAVPLTFPGNVFRPERGDLRFQLKFKAP
jgi:hypothetical protein